MRLRPVYSCVLALAVTAAAGSLCAQSIAEQQMAEQLKGVDVVQKIGDKLPLDVPFVDDNGRNVTLAQYFKPGVPVLITLNYADCPRNCSLQLTDLARALREMQWKPGTEFTIVTISVDPAEDFKRARQSKIRYLGASESGSSVDKGWHFLTSSDESNARRVADALGYHYRYDVETRQYLHKTAMFIVTPDGVISHYIRSLGYDGSMLEGYLQASAQGRLGAPISDDGTGFGLNCFVMEYTDNIGRAYLMMRIGGSAVLAFVVCFVGYFWLRELKRVRAARRPNLETA
ncbi:MAG: SCO family protein [Planctomycetes bacterium]|jgi:protein SCO1/2|nr:SCO family protein [Planctomycetota bacterium]MCL4729985.1 SCO family protein [Planctomycetota bacterium]